MLPMPSSALATIGNACGVSGDCTIVEGPAPLIVMLLSSGIVEVRW